MKIEDLILTYSGITFCKICGKKQQTTEVRDRFIITIPFKHEKDCIFF